MIKVSDNSIRTMELKPFIQKLKKNIKLLSLQAMIYDEEEHHEDILWRKFINLVGQLENTVDSLDIQLLTINDYENTKIYLDEKLNQSRSFSWGTSKEVKK